MVQFNADWTEIEKHVQQAIDQLRKNDALLFNNHANERSITHRLAVYLEKPFEGWNVDCEYNRIGDNANEYKYLLNYLVKEGDGDPFDLDGSRIYPDIVIHHRGENDISDNLLVIEVKTSWSEKSNERDINKLNAFV